MTGRSDNVHDVIIIGAGANGINQLHRIRQAGFVVVALEAGAGVGGAWYWNRYPGARLDSECYSYAYTPEFSAEVSTLWEWEEEFADQPTLEAYFNFVIDRLDLRRSIVFNSRVVSARWDEPTRTWRITTEDGATYESRHVVAATGILSVPFVPDYPGIQDFGGTILHTANWPAEGIDLAGRRVIVIGVGSTGIQVIQTIASKVEHLTVLQRTPNWATPLNNYRYSEERKAEVKAQAADIMRLTGSTRSCFVRDRRSESTWDVTDEERMAILQDLYAAPGLSLYSGGFDDLLTDAAANREVTNFLSAKIAERVHDPETARKLTPHHPFATKRPPMETGYYEVYNRPNVSLVHLPEEPIVRFVENGVETTEGFYEADMIVVATGFDAITGSFLHLGVEGTDGVTLRDWWEDGPRTYLGVFAHHFPNLFILGGPQGVNGNHPRCADFASDWIARAITRLRETGVSRIEVSDEFEDEWIEYCNSFVAGTLLEDAVAWQWGSNIPGKKRRYMLYIGPQPTFRLKLEEVLASDFGGFDVEEERASSRETDHARA